MDKESLRRRANELRLYGLLAHWGEVADTAWPADLVRWEEEERSRRSLERRIRSAQLGRFKHLCDFDWNWPARCDRAAIEDLMTLEFMESSSNVVLLGPNGVGKSMLAHNLTHQALVRGFTALFTTAGQMLGDLAAQETDAALQRRLRFYAAPDLLAIDEIGYLSYSNRHADLLFTLVNLRYEAKSTVVTTNKTFSEWSSVFPNAACVVSLVDRLLHKSEVIVIEGKSYRLKEAQDLAAQREGRRRKPKKAASAAVA